MALGGSSFRVIYNDRKYKEQVVLKLSQFANYIPFISVVIGARATPGQKAEFVSLVKHTIPDSKTLAVGDGANDVSMICTANVGIAIFGKEGLQASTASDFSIPEFKMLKPLLLHHGTEFARINKDYVLYNFYKNFVLCVPQICFAPWSGYSALNFLNPILYQLYNILHAFLPILWYGLFDKSENASYFYQRKSLYSSFKEGRPNSLNFLGYLKFNGVASLIAFVCFYLR